MNDFSNVSVQSLKRAIKIKTRLDTLQTQYDKIMGGNGSEMHSPFQKRGISVAGRRRIAAAQKLRWAKAKGKGPKKGRRKMSAAGRAKIAAAAKLRWKKAKAEGRTRL